MLSHGRELISVPLESKSRRRRRNLIIRRHLAGPKVAGTQHSLSNRIRDLSSVFRAKDGKRSAWYFDWILRPDDPDVSRNGIYKPLSSSYFLLRMLQRNVINLFIDHRQGARKRDEEEKREREQNRLLLLRFERRCTGLTFRAHRKSARRCLPRFCCPFCVFETSVSPAERVSRLSFYLDSVPCRRFFY